MKKIIPFFLISIFLITVFIHSGCKKDKNQDVEFILDVKGYVGNDFLVMGQTYQNILGQSFRVEKLRFYVSNFTLIKADGGEVVIKDYDYLRFENNHASNQNPGERIKADAPSGFYKGIKFSIGVDPSVNNGDPAQYAPGHPLSILTNEAHWGWSTGYIFLKFEGDIDQTPGSGSLDQSFLYHTGLNELYRTISFDKDFEINGGADFTYQLKLDVAKMFYSDTDTLNAAEDNITHTLGPQSAFETAERVTELFIKAFSNN